MTRTVTRQETQLLNALRTKTEDGKISWRQCAAPDEYITAIGGKLVYILRRVPTEEGNKSTVIQLEGRDPNQDTSLFELEYSEVLEARNLFYAVKNLHVNDKLAESLELINQL